MVHFGPLAGRPDAPAYRKIADKAKHDLRVLLQGKIDAVMFENMYDQPHTERLDAARVKEFDALLATLTRNLKIPFGLSLLWNDFPNAFRLAKKHGAGWIRVPVFVDSVKTNYGTFLAKPKNVIQTRQKIGASKVAIMADVQVKHSTMVRPRPIAASARDSICAGADMVIVTGKWTGDPPTVADVHHVRSAVGTTPIIIGSGITARNIATFIPLVSGMIVGTDFKSGGASDKYAMRAPWQQPLALSRVRQLMAAVKK